MTPALFSEFFRFLMSLSRVSQRRAREVLKSGSHGMLEIVSPHPAPPLAVLKLMKKCVVANQLRALSPHPPHSTPQPPPLDLQIPSEMIRHHP